MSPAQNGTQWNHRFRCYALAHGHTCEAQGVADKARYPGGRMTGFLVWMSGAWTLWRGLRGVSAFEPLTPEHHADFDGWVYGYAFARAEERVS